MFEIKKAHLLAAIRSGRRLDGERFAKSCGTMRSKDRWLLPFQAPYQHASFDASDLPEQPGGISVSRFEKKANAARRRAALNQASIDPDWPTLKSSVLIDALAEATRELSDPDAAAHTPLFDFNIMSGLQIYGVEIVPDVAFRNGSLNLVNVSFPFSVRLICCVLRVPVALSNVQLVTLDLSGSALLGLDAKFLHARGSVRMRRSFSLGPVDFAGAEIHGYFDACDLLILPFGQTPADQAVDGDSGMLSLNQASIDNEVRLNRAEIWGGLSMRGLRTKRSIHINESRIFSPLATLERLFLDQMAPMEDWKEIKPGGAKSTGYEGGLRWHRFINRVAFLKYAPGHEAISTRAINLFLCENLRVRTSAVRADAMTVDGSIFAKDMKCRGRFRMKYARISGGLSM